MFVKTNFFYQLIRIRLEKIKSHFSECSQKTNNFPTDQDKARTGKIKPGDTWSSKKELIIISAHYQLAHYQLKLSIGIIN